MEGGTTFFDAIGTAFTEWIGWGGEFVSALTSGDLSALLIPMAIGIGASAVLFTVRLVRSVTWGS